MTAPVPHHLGFVAIGRPQPAQPASVSMLTAPIGAT